MADTKTPPRLRGLSRTEQAAVDLLDQGMDIAVVCDQTGLTRPQVAAASDLREARAKALTEAAAAVQHVPMGEPRRASAQPPLLSAVSTDPEHRDQAAAVVRFGLVDELLDWGRARQDEEARKIVASVVIGLGRLRELRERSREMERLRGKEQQLVSELDAVRHRMRQLHGGLLPADLDRETRHKIREWGRAQGYQIGTGGVIRADVVEAYWQAHTPAP